MKEDWYKKPLVAAVVVTGVGVAGYVGYRFYLKKQTTKSAPADDKKTKENGQGEIKKDEPAVCEPQPAVKTAPPVPPKPSLPHKLQARKSTEEPDNDVSVTLSLPNNHATDRTPREDQLTQASAPVVHSAPVPPPQQSERGVTSQPWSSRLDDKPLVEASKPAVQPAAIPVDQPEVSEERSPSRSPPNVPLQDDSNSQSMSSSDIEILSLSSTPEVAFEPPQRPSTPERELSPETQSEPEVATAKSGTKTNIQRDIFPTTPTAGVSVSEKEPEPGPEPKPEREQPLSQAVGEVLPEPAEREQPLSQAVGEVLPEPAQVVTKERSSSPEKASSDESSSSESEDEELEVRHIRNENDIVVLDKQGS